MTLTAAQLAKCALLLGAGAMIQPTVKAVKQHSPKPVAVKAKGERKALSPARSRVAPVEARQPSAPRILDCPSPAPSLGGSGFTLPAPPSPFGAVALGQPGAGGVWDGPNTRTPPTFPPAVPEPDAWGLWIAGFGLVGLSLRSRKAVA